MDVTCGSPLTQSTQEKSCMGGPRLLPKNGNTLAKLLCGSSRAYVNQTIDSNDGSFSKKKKSAFSQLRKVKLYEAFPGDGAIL